MKKMKRFTVNEGSVSRSRKKLSKEELDKRKREIINHVEEAIDSDGFYIVITRFSGNEEFNHINDNCYVDEALSALSLVNANVLSKIKEAGKILGWGQLEKNIELTV
jgi:hypothetical protein